MFLIGGGCLLNRTMFIVGPKSSERGRLDAEHNGISGWHRYRDTAVINMDNLTAARLKYYIFSNAVFHDYFYKNNFA